MTPKERAAILERLERARARGDRWWEAPHLVKRSAWATHALAHDLDGTLAAFALEQLEAAGLELSAA